MVTLAALDYTMVKPGCQQEGAKNSYTPVTDFIEVRSIYPFYFF